MTRVKRSVTAITLPSWSIAVGFTAAASEQLIELLPDERAKWPARGALTSRGPDGAIQCWAGLDQTHNGNPQATRTFGRFLGVPETTNQTWHRQKHELGAACRRMSPHCCLKDSATSRARRKFDMLQVQRSASISGMLRRRERMIACRTFVLHQGLNEADIVGR